MKQLKQRLDELTSNIKFRLSTLDKLIPVSILSIVIGFFTGLVIIVFRWVIEQSQIFILDNNNPEDYESLSLWARFALPLLGGLVIGIIFQRVAESSRGVGVVHVMRYLQHHQGKLPLKNAVLQFVGAALSIISGHSVGREGPSVHLGAASGSLLGQILLVPNNVLRTLVGCGVAAAIAASFNTPLAGVIFAMEVILMEYTIMSFIPVIIAAVVATALMRAVYGDEQLFHIPIFEMGSLDDLSNVFIMALAIGILATIFIQSLRFFSRQLTQLAIWQRATIAGALTGLVAMAVPQVMGIGYDTVTAAALGQYTFWLLILITLAKVLATTLGLGLGLPGGLIGPTVVIGATFGAAFGTLWATGETSLGFYALIGMAAMMSATLNAPLAALTAILELTSNPGIIMPGMLAIVIANLTTTQIFAQDSIYHLQLKDKGMHHDDNPVAQYLRRISINNLLKGPVFILPATPYIREIFELIHHHRHGWVLVKCPETNAYHLFELDKLELDLAAFKDTPDDTIELLALPSSQKMSASAVNLRDSLQDALNIIREKNVDALFAVHNTHHWPSNIYGIITRSDIEKKFLEQVKNGGGNVQKN